VETPAVMDYPELSSRDVEEELKLIHRIRHRTFTTALYAKSSKSAQVVVDIGEAKRTYDVIAVHCELQLRRALADQAEERDLLLLLDFDADRLAADIQGRIAAGKVYAVERGRRLARLFNAQNVSSQVLASRELCSLLLAEPWGFDSLGFTGLTLDLHSAWRAALHRYAGLPFEGDLSADRLLFEALVRAPSAEVRARLGRQAPVSAALGAYLLDVTGARGPVIWQAWLDGRAETVAALAFVLEVAASRWSADAGLRASITGRLQQLDESLLDASKRNPTLLGDWGRLAEPLWRRLSDEPQRERRRRILALANTVVVDEEVARGALFESRYLPLAFDVVSESLARSLARGATHGPSAALIEEAHAELERLAAHRRAEEPIDGERVARARMALRLLAYLVARPDLDAEASTYGASGAMFALPKHYLSDGAFVDRARQQARGTVTNDLERAIDAVLQRVDRLRDADDEKFARAYASWLNEDRGSSQHVVPIHAGLDHFAVKFLKDKPHRKLLIVLLDGMSWANAVELLESCETRGFAPLLVSEPSRLPLLAAVPSLTEVSRSALFAGKPIKAGEAGTKKDPERFEAHAGLRRIGIEAPRLFLRSDVETGSGDLNSKTLDLVHLRDRVVAVVINALDDQLHGARQLRVPADLEHIKMLGRLLDEATLANRALLLIADHGHVRTDRMLTVGYGGDGTRYRYLSEGEGLRENEVAVSREAALVKPGKAKVALLYRDCDSYGTTSDTGTHGGISLAEIVTPALLVGSDQLRGRVQAEDDENDPGLAVAPFPRPDWWEFILPKKAAKAPKKSTSVPKLPAVPAQVTLPFEPAPPPPVAPPRAAPTVVSARPAAGQSPADGSAWLERLRKLDVWGDRSASELARFRDKTARHIAVLADAGGSLPAEQFARTAQVLTRNVGGAVSEMQEWINFDGYMVVSYDPAARRVTLDMVLFKAFVKENG
jgi:hypothetical protein